MIMMDDLDDSTASPREQAAFLLAMDELTWEQIAEKAGCSKSSIRRWKMDRDFMFLVDEHRRAIRGQIRSHGIAIRENRIAALQRRWDKANRIIEARAADPEMQEVPGGDTGLVVCEPRTIGAGVNAERVDVFKVDVALMSELRAIEEQAAKELGQWEEKKSLQVTGADGGPVQVKYDLSKLTKEDWLAIRHIRERSAADRAAATN